MGKYMRKAKHRDKKGVMQALKSTARLGDACYLELRSRKLKKTIQQSTRKRSACRTAEKALEVDQTGSNCNCDLDQVAQNFTPEFGSLCKSSSVEKISNQNAKKASAPCNTSQLWLQVSMEGACISRSSSFSALPQASLCITTPPESITCRKMQTQDPRHHFLNCEDALTEQCLQEMEVSLGDNSPQIDQDRLSLRTSSPKILGSRQCSRAATPCSLSQASTHNKVTSLTVRPVSATDHFDERTGDEGPFTAALCKRLFGSPSREEIDGFFAEVEQQENKLFTERYNFDFQNGRPFHGRYEWISLVHS